MIRKTEGRPGYQPGVGGIELEIDWPTYHIKRHD